MKKQTIVLAALAIALGGAATAAELYRSGATLKRAEGTVPFTSHVLKADKATAIAPMSARVAKAKAKDVPFIEDFTTADNLGDWGIQDVNNDGNSWEYKQAWGLVQCYFPTSGSSNDDWLVTPAINLGKDDVYTITFSYGSQGTRFAPEQLTVTMGTSEYATRHTTVLYKDLNITNFWNGSMKTVTITLPVDEDAPYYFGFHCTSPSNGYCLYLDDVRVEQNGTKAAPAAVENLTITPGAKGALEAEVAFDTPSLNAEGGALSQISAVNIYRDEELVKTFAAPATGAHLSFTDSGMATGTHTWRVLAELDGEEGAKAEATAYIGVDAPMAVTGLKAKENADGSVTVTWDAALGVNGGYTGSDVTTYQLVRTDGSDEVTLRRGTADTSYTDTSIPSDAQSYLYYTVVAKTSAGTSEAAESNSIFAGPAYDVPFKENFAWGTLNKNPWVMETVVSTFLNPSWSIVAQGVTPLCPTIDGDDGMLGFATTLGGMNFYQGAQVRIATPAISLKGTTAPYLSFYIFHYDTTEISQEYDSENEEYVTVTNTYKDKIHVQVSVDNGAYTDVPGAVVELAANNGGWTKYRVDLSAYKDAAKASIGILGVADGGGNIYIDNLLITDTYTTDLEITDILGPQSAKVGEKADYLVRVVNNGTASTKAYTVGLYLDDKQVASASNPGAAIFANGGEKMLSLSFTPGLEHSGATHKLQARINFAADECAANDASDEIAFDVPALAFPAIDAIEGSTDGDKVTISWDEPDFAAFRAKRTDDIENFTAFAISGLGDYTLVDNDKSSTTYCISGITGYDNAQAAMAYQVFNPARAGVDLDEPFNRRWYARSGKQFLISWGASDTSVDANDDWLISPELSGEEQVVSFYIKSVSLAYAERFRVLYSRDTKSISDFVKVAEANYYTPGGKWRKFSVRLPQGAKYFAIHCISADAFGLMVDDLSFVPAKGSAADYDLLGYNVYRDGVKLNTEPVADNTFTDTPGAGLHSYAVTTLYASGESSPSPKYETGTTSVATAAAASFAAYGHQGCLELFAPDAEVFAQVFTIDGRTVLADAVSGSATYTLAPGLYIVKAAGYAAKVVVK